MYKINNKNAGKLEKDASAARTSQSLHNAAPTGNSQIVNKN